MKNILMTLSLVGLLLTTSCNDNDHLVPENETSAKLTHDELQRQIQNVKSINQKFENELTKEFFGVIDSKALLEIAKSDKNRVNVASNEEMASSLTKYHNMRLQKIDKMRNEMGFVSIQSIADEINSLTLINKNLADKLFHENARFLEKTLFGISVKMDSELASVTDKNGNIYNLNKKINISVPNNSESRPTTPLREGILVSNGLFAVTWHANYWEKGGIHLDYWKYKHETRIGTYISWYGTYILYPSIITIWDGKYQFNHDGMCLGTNSKHVDFASGTWVTDTYNCSSDSSAYPWLCSGNINGSFATIVGNNQVLYLNANTSLP